MGGPLSPVLARLYLDTRHDRLYRSPRSLHGLCGFVAILGRRTTRWVATRCHVDDSIWISRVLCQNCLFLVAKAVWPVDVGITVESQDLVFPFLHCTVDWSSGTLDVVPTDHNAAFASGVADSPAVCGLPRFDRRYLSKSHLQAYVAAKVQLLLRGYTPTDVVRFADALVNLALEPVALLWPPRWVANILYSVAYPKNRPGLRICRRLGYELRVGRALAAQATVRQATLGPTFGLSALREVLEDRLRDPPWLLCPSAGHDAAHVTNAKKTQRRTL